MPIPKDATREEVFHDIRHGKTYSKTRKKHGKKSANRQMVAIAMKYRKGGKRKGSR